jgi:hypothetical protein
VDTAQRNSPPRSRRVHSPRKDSQISIRSWRTLPHGPPEVKASYHPQGNGETKSPAGKRECTSVTGSNVAGNRRKHTTNSVTGKRIWDSTKGQNDESDDEDAWKRQKQPRQLSSSSPKPTEPEFACPFGKRYPSENVGCGRRSWPNTARIK